MSFLYVDIEYRQELGDFLNRHGLLGTGAEIGTAAGTYASEIMARWKGSKLICVDPWARQPMDVYREDHHKNDYDAWYNQCVELARLDPRIELRRMFSHQGVVGIADESLDFVYIDANHAYAAVLLDMDTWFSKVKHGGVFGGHDYGNDINWPHWCEVKLAVDRWASEHNIVFVFSRCGSWWMKKP